MRCTCKIKHDEDGQYIDYCPLHRAAGALLEALKALQAALSEHHLRNVKRFSLLVADAQATAAIRKAEGGDTHV